MTEPDDRTITLNYLASLTETQRDALIKTAAAQRNINHQAMFADAVSEAFDAARNAELRDALTEAISSHTNDDRNNS
ncbi:hypothetical protein LH935_03580 [Gordonia polyisoprenivorans]|uniref:hypothetical protein n=1 Tax=Gordonia polyisoprenivorans TaxID=84595 RepID=UPI0022340713|nr:hypothetical protein LH935_03580 [Gordonia polyisoprenivorans]